MAKVSSVQKNLKRIRLSKKFANKRNKLKAIIDDLNKPAEERVAARMKLAQLPRNSSPTRIRNRCELTGRARGFYRRVKLSRISLRKLASEGFIVGMKKASW